MRKNWILKFRIFGLRKPEQKIIDRSIPSNLSYCWCYVLLPSDAMAAVLSETGRSEFIVETGDEWLIKYTCNPINMGPKRRGNIGGKNIVLSQSFVDCNLSCWLLMSQNSDRYLQFVGPWEILQHVSFSLMAWLICNMVSTTVRAKERALLW
jgi:hypothetical protein